MQFSGKLATAVHILLYIEKYQDEEKITSEVLADTTGVNAVNIRKILTNLKSSGLVIVKAGVGGTYLNKKPEEISVRMIFESVEGHDQKLSVRMIFESVEGHDQKLFRMHEHPNVNCPVGRTIQDVLEVRLQALQDELLQKMEHMYLSDMYDDMENILNNE